MKYFNTAQVLAISLVTISSFSEIAKGALNIDFSDGVDGLNVTVSGGLDTSGATAWNVFTGDLGYSANFSSAISQMWVPGPDGGNYQWSPHGGSTGPWFSALADGSYSTINHSGDDFGLWDDNYMVPIGYVSGAPISSSYTITGLDLATLAPVSGTVLTIASGDIVTVSTGVSIAAVPEPSSTLLLGLASMGFLTRRRRAR